VGAAQGSALHLVALQDLPRPLPWLFLEGQVVDDVEQAQPERESAGCDLLPLAEGAGADEGLGQGFVERRRVVLYLSPEANESLSTSEEYLR